MTRERAIVTRVERSLTFDQVTVAVEGTLFIGTHFYTLRTAVRKTNKGDVVWVHATSKGLEIE